MTEIRLLRRLGDVERAVRKPEVIIEQDLIAPEGESEEWVTVHKTREYVSVTVGFH